ncbi:unnamed protein product [Scytosiphon promiscuus]
MSRLAESSSDDGNMSDYDFVDVEGASSSSDDDTVTSSLAPPKGWSTLSLADADGSEAGPAVITSSTAAAAGARGRREFISSPGSSATSATASFSPSVIKKSSTRFEPAAPASAGAFSCRACDHLLRDCVECPTCHSLFCRDHLVIDKQSGKSPCPCEPCRPTLTVPEQEETITPNNNIVAPFSTTPAPSAPPAQQRRLHPHEAFLPNIPVQRMADAVPSRCDGCGISLTWGELALHACDQQLVPCRHKDFGCRWFGQRHEADSHAESSTCPGRLARAQRANDDLRAQLAAARAETQAAERRASSAEMRASDLEARLEVAEKGLRESGRETHALREKMTTMSAAAAVEAAENNKKQEKLQQQLQSAVADVKKGGKLLQQARNAGRAGSSSAANSSSSSSGGASSTAANSTPAAAAPSPMAPLGFAAMLNRAGFSPPPPPPAARPAPPQLVVTERNEAATATAAATTQTTTPATTASRQGSRGNKGALTAAVKMARAGGGSAASARGGATTDTACQAPVPAVEACLKPYLDRPSSLLEKKVVVFWPRQGRWYVGRPTVYKEDTKEHRVEYDDGDVRDHVLAHRSWGLIG